MKKHILFSLFLLSAMNLVACSPSAPDSVTFNATFDTDVNFHTDLQQGLINSDNPKQYIDSNWDDITDQSMADSKPTTISWEAIADNGAKASRYEFNLWETRDVDNVITYKTKEPSIDLYNLKINTSYSYSITAYYGSMGLHSLDYIFTTYATGKIRNLYVDGVINMRDLGGYELEDPNKVMKQGLIYRSAQFNYDTSDESSIESAPTDEGKKTLINDLKIKTEIDLRDKTTRSGRDETFGINSSPIDSSVNYISLSMRFGGNNVLTHDYNKESLKSFFELCADINNYPIVFHCIRGTDRTGALAYALEALCGVSKADMMRDYYFSNFALDSKIMDISGKAYYPYEISESPGITMSEKAINYLTTKIGVSEETLNKIIDILTTKKDDII